jgi:2,3-bisphosphoglycerate-independent phosphoglycerate mutase
MIGRYYAMDRDRRWQRVKSAYDLLTQGRRVLADNLRPGWRPPTRAAKPTTCQGDGDPAAGRQAGEDGRRRLVIFLNFRSDRARQLSRPFIEPDFSEFEREAAPRLATYCTLTGYSDDFAVSVAFPPERIKNGLGEYIAKLGLRQLRIAETEKYPHVTFFFNGGEEVSFPGEDRVLVPSPDVATYDLKPEMSAFEVTEKLLAAINSKQYDVIICNYANPDMVGHTGDLQAAIKAIETVDTCLGRVVEAQLARGGEVR